MKRQACDARSARPKELSRSARAIFAVAGGMSVANVYYAQPLLDGIANSFAIDPAHIGLVVTVTQIGYALGLILAVPLGDLVDRRRLILGQFILSACALSVVGTAQQPALLLVGMAAVGFFAVTIQVLVAFAAARACPNERGRTIGTVTGGVVIGILVARFVSGLLADLGGWRTVYVASAGAMLAMTGLLARALPRDPVDGPRPPYGAVLRSVPRLFASDPVLRTRGLFALLIFATFSTLWTALVLPLGAPPLSLSHTEIGLFGLAGLAGVLAARGAGGLADRGQASRATGAALTLLLGSWLPIVLLPVSLAFLVVGVVMLDLAVQAVHVVNQSVIIARHPEARSRLIGGYMVFYSAGSALGALGATLVYARAGWSGVSGLGACFSAAALILWSVDARRAPDPP